MMILSILMTAAVFSEVLAQFTINTHLGADNGPPVVRKGAAFVYQYQALTSESESKVRIFSPFPRMPEMDKKQLDDTLADANAAIKNLHLRSFLYAPSTYDELSPGNVTYTCATLPTNLEAMDLAMVGVIWQTNLVKAEITGAQKDLEDLVQRARSFANPKEEERKAAWTAGTEHRKSFSRDKRAAPLFLAAAGAGLILGNPIKNAACKALSIFDMCEDQSKLKNTVNGILKGQKQLEANLKRMADVANEKFFLLGTEIEQTQKSVEAVKNVMNENFQRTQNNILQIANAVKDINECQARAADLHQFENELGNYATYLSAVFAHYKAFRASFYAYQTSLYSAIASLSSGFITPNILTPDQIRQVVDELTDEEVRR